ncbi:MAG: hypothetical protein U9O63_08555 [Actinomycetota bacterium]|nr:hypothetical protein [Actinomycetota bacterium]
MCALGQFLEVDDGEESASGDDWVDDEYDCSDGSGTFMLHSVSPGDEADEFDPAVGFDGTWTVLSGTGSYSALGGSGDFHSVLRPEWVDTYNGELTNPG